MEKIITILDMETFERLAEPTDFFDKTRAALQSPAHKQAIEVARKEIERAWSMCAGKVPGYELE